MSDDDDWFERALREDDESEDADEDGREDGDVAVEREPTTAEPRGESPIDETEGESGSEDESKAGSEDGSKAGSEDESQVEPQAAARETEGARSDEKTDQQLGEQAASTGADSGGPDESSGPAGSKPGSTSDESVGDSPFEEDFASALENAPDPGAGVGAAMGEASESSPPDEGGSESPFGPADAGAGGGDDFGFANFEDDTDDFDEESFDSDLERLDIGIGGLDQMILGGVPRRSLMVAVGSAGTGKTTFGLQFLNHGLENGEDAVYIALEESHERILATAGEKGWEFERYVEEDRLAIVDIDPIEMANSLDSIQNDLPELIKEFGADRLVLDSVSLLEMMYESAQKRRSQVFGFTRALKSAGITTLLTSEANDDNPYTSRFGIVEYLADAVFVLQYVRPSDFRETRLAIEIQKIRDANHSRETKPYELTAEGISVYRQANIF